MADSSSKLIALPTRIDRYPAKMISHLATALVDRFASSAAHLVDPFCGSGAVLRAASLRGIPVTGIDLNPFGVLLTGVKLQGFEAKRAQALCEILLEASDDGSAFPVDWEMKDYWFTPATRRKYEQLRHHACQMNLHSTMAGRAVLLAFGLSIRQCSRADQRSPKPFISKHARRIRKGRHYDPGFAIKKLLHELCALYGRRTRADAKVIQMDVSDTSGAQKAVARCSHIITSPPYINAQDYFRNSKLELYLLEGVLPYKVSDLIHRFIGTERGVEREVLYGKCAVDRRRLVPELVYLEKHREDQAVVLHRYLQDIAGAFRTIKSLVIPGGTVVVVCGDNLIGGRRICTWQVLNKMLEQMGFTIFDSFGDRIRNRAVAPSRCGHKGLIKEEIISAFQVP